MFLNRARCQNQIFKSIIKNAQKDVNTTFPHSKTSLKKFTVRQQLELLPALLFSSHRTTWKLSWEDCGMHADNQLHKDFQISLKLLLFNPTITYNSSGLVFTKLKTGLAKKKKKSNKKPQSNKKSPHHKTKPTRKKKDHKNPAPH